MRSGGRLRQALEHRVVLAVDRQQRRAVLAHRAHEQRPGHHQRFLVGEEQPLAGARAAQDRGKSDCPDNCGNQHIAFRVCGDLLERRTAE